MKTSAMTPSEIKTLVPPQLIAEFTKWFKTGKPAEQSEFWLNTMVDYHDKQYTPYRFLDHWNDELVRSKANGTKPETPIQVWTRESRAREKFLEGWYDNPFAPEVDSE
jgi:hypothetical protein